PGPSALPVEEAHPRLLCWPVRLRVSPVAAPVPGPPQDQGP
ncbi:hypothetical protein BN1708_019008, partial [Verticillium longisporum]